MNPKSTIQSLIEQLDEQLAQPMHLDTLTMLDLIAGALPETEATEANAHLANCKQCAQELMAQRFRIAEIEADEVQNVRMWKRLQEMIHPAPRVIPTDTMQGEGSPQRVNYVVRKPTLLPMRLAAGTLPKEPQVMGISLPELGIEGEASASLQRPGKASSLWLAVLSEGNLEPPPVQAEWSAGRSPWKHFEFVKPINTWAVSIEIPIPWPEMVQLLNEGQLVVRLQNQ